VGSSGRGSIETRKTLASSRTLAATVGNDVIEGAPVS
jgi:hypothetical protein